MVELREKTRGLEVQGYRKGGKAFEEGIYQSGGYTLEMAKDLVDQWKEAYPRISEILERKRRIVMKTANQMNTEYRKALGEAKGEEELRDLCKMLLDSLVAVKTLLEAGKEENPIPYRECTGKGVATPWLIVEDLVDNGKAIGICGGAGISQRQYDLLRDNKDKAAITLFRLFDDDGEMYYEGRMVEGGESEGFEPLDDFGMPNAGCTGIRIYNDITEEWEEL